MAITRTAMVDDDGSGATGTIINNAWKTEFYNQIDAALLGSVSTRIVIPYSASYYAAGGSMIWTVDAGDQLQLEYTKVGNLIWVFFNIYGSVISGTANSDLKITLPGVTFSAQVSNAIQATHAGGKTTGYTLALPGTGSLILRKVDETAWGLGNCALHGQVCAPVSAALAMDESWVRSFDPPPPGGTYPEGAAAL